MQSSEDGWWRKAGEGGKMVLDCIGGWITKKRCQGARKKKEACPSPSSIPPSGFNLPGLRGPEVKQRTGIVKGGKRICQHLLRVHCNKHKPTKIGKIFKFDYLEFFFKKLSFSWCIENVWFWISILEYFTQECGQCSERSYYICIAICWCKVVLDLHINTDACAHTHTRSHTRPFSCDSRT